MKVRRLIFLLPLLFYLPLRAQDEVAEDFVISSILYAEPGGALYSKAGHVAIRMQCPDHSLDYVFSYESEDASRKVLSFLGGRLKMGLLAIPYSDYLAIYEPDKRAVTEYVLNLPIEKKQNLWRVLDGHMMEGRDLPYDYLQRGCAQSTLRFLREGLSPGRIEYGPWPESFSLSRREITALQMERYPWTWFFLNLICNGSIDSKCSNEQKVIMPADLLTVLKGASFEGRPLMQQEGTVVLPGVTGVKTKEALPFTPLQVAVLLLVLSSVCLLGRKHWMDVPLLVIQSAIGLVSTYLVLFSTLPCTEWSLLLVPFNPLPLLLWKWRRRWGVPFAVLCLAWAVVMVLLPHTMTDFTYIVLALAVSVSAFGLRR